MAIPFFSKVQGRRHYYDAIKSDLKKVEEMIESQVEQFDPLVAEYMEKICSSKGKMLRAGLVLLSAGATGGIKDSHIKLAAVIEMLHLASLVHDDVMDGADMRRNEVTANALWGNTLSVLLGDALFAHALVLGADFESVAFCKKLGRLMRDVCQGEVEQSSRLFDLQMTKGDYYEIIRKKTASLFSAATGGAAWLSGVGDKIENSMFRVGELLGTSYQIYDDCLDMVGDENSAGKTLHTDAARGKLTLPIFYMLESDDEDVVHELKSSISARRSPDFTMLMESPVYHASIAAAVNKARKMNDEAREILWELPQTTFREAIAELTFYFDELLQDCVRGS